MSINTTIVPEKMVEFLKTWPISQIVEFSGHWEMTSKHYSGQERFAVVLSSIPLIVSTIESNESILRGDESNGFTLTPLGPQIKLAPDLVNDNIVSSWIHPPRSTYEPEVVSKLSQHIERCRTMKHVTTPLALKRDLLPQWPETAVLHLCILEGCLLGEVYMGGDRSKYYLFTPWSNWAQFISRSFFEELRVKE